MDIMLDPQELAPHKARLLRREEFDRMVEIGIFDDERVELLRGVVVCMTPNSPPHDATLQRLTRLLVMAVGERGWVRVASAWAADDWSEPLPDLAIVPPGEYDRFHPDRAWLIVEVSRSTLRKDRTIKRALYAESRVPEYWIVDIVNGVVEVCRSSDGKKFRNVRTFQKDETIELCSLPDIRVAVADVLR
jgi:Uma2 family endonuclease